MSTSTGRLRRTSSDALVLAEDSSQESANENFIPAAQPQDQFDDDYLDEAPPPGQSRETNCPAPYYPLSPSEDEEPTQEETQPTQIATQPPEFHSLDNVYLPASNRTSLRNQNNKPWRRQPKDASAASTEDGDDLDLGSPLPTPVGDYYDLDPTQPITQPPEVPTQRTDSGYDSRDEEEDNPPASHPIKTESNAPSPVQDSKMRISSIDTHLGIQASGNTPEVNVPSGRKKRKLAESTIATASGYPESVETVAEAGVGQKRKRGRGKQPTSNASAGPSTIRSSRRSSRQSTQGQAPYSASEPECTRVFALWEPDKHYYPGYTLQRLLDGGGLYSVRFDDGNTANVELANLRACTPRLGDVVSGPERVWKGGVVVAVDGELSDSVVRIKLSGVEEEFSIRDISIPSNAVKANWRNRTIEDADIKVAQSPTTRLQRNAVSMAPTPGLKTRPTTGRSRTKGKGKARVGEILSDTAFVITVSLDSTSREEIQKTIKDHGGHLLKDWSDVITVKNDEPDNTDKRWFLRQRNINYKPNPHGVKRFLLLSDASGSKPKYLTAIALGIPCLSNSWLDAWLAEPSADAHELGTYLLPQGNYRGVELSQQVDLSWLTTGDMDRIAHNPIPPKIMKGKKVLVFGRSLVMPKEARDKLDRTPIPEILLAMGAEEIETVKDPKDATSSYDEYDLIVAKERSDAKKFDSIPLGVPVLWSWVKECLFLGREAPKD